MKKIKPVRQNEFLWEIGGQALKLFSKPFMFMKIIHNVKSRIFTTISKLSVSVLRSKEPIPFADRQKLQYKPINIGEKWGGAFDCAWFNMSGTVPLTAKGQHIFVVIDINGEGCIMDKDGTPVKGLARVLGFSEALNEIVGKKTYEITKCANGTEDINLWIEGGNNGGLLKMKDAKLKRADITVYNAEMAALYFDLLTLYIFVVSLSRKSAKYKQIMSTLRKALSIINSYSDAEIKQAREILAVDLNKQSDDDFTFYSSGHAHLDLAWLWPIRETKRKAGRTMANQIDLINNYPDYVYSASQPQMYEWLKNIYPGLYAKVVKAVSNNRLEPVGGMWVEPDCNLPSGESLVRQVLYGKRFFREEFGKDIKTVFLPDVFGYNGALPQIMKKSGIEYFLTSKMSWNNYNKFPYHSFLWKGIDGTPVLAHLSPAGNYNTDLTGGFINKAYDNYKEKDTKVASILFGAGDGGGGPSKVNVEMLNRQVNLEGVKKLKAASVNSFFEELNKKRDILPVWQGELYLEKHNGTYTTQAKNKLYNRKIENLLHDVETLATFAHFTKGYKYPSDKLNIIWKEMLLYQFHDIIPGSSIKRVYDECIPRYLEMMNELSDIKNEIIKHLSIDKQPTVINTTSYKRSEWVTDGSDWFIGEAEPYSSAKLKVGNSKEVSYDEIGIYSDKLSVKFWTDGSISSLIDKAIGKEFAGERLNRLTVYRDKKLAFNAWDIDAMYINHSKGCFRLISQNTFVDGARVIRRNFMAYNKSTIKQDIILTAGCPYVEFVTTVDWQETHKMLRADFVPSIYADEVTCNIQFGNIRRSTKTDNIIDYAQYEICAHKWVDVSNDGYGLALLNDCKYGHRVKDGLISLNLLRSTVYPDKTADRGVHTFRYALYPHSNSAEQSEVVKLGYTFNNPMEIINSNVDIHKFVSIDNDQVIIETIKKAEDSEGIVVRLYESIGQTANAKLSMSLNNFRAFEINLIEDIEGDIDINNLTFHPFEIKTILFQKIDKKEIVKEEKIEQLKIEEIIEKPVEKAEKKVIEKPVEKAEKKVIEDPVENVQKKIIEKPVHKAEKKVIEHKAEVKKEEIKS